ncbi:hypothetical protein [Streptomyces sp. NPDC006132]|uniref:hypothetical protein n=1 Tax=Streptomyces sp. NPDC006132 TaxID=3156732 RepID=UPI0033E3888C
MSATPSAWGVQYILCLPTEDAARAAAAELTGLGHRLVAVRAHDHFRFVPSHFWYGKPPMDPELEGWWQTFSLAVYAGYDRMQLGPLLRGERMQVARVARAHGGFHQGGSEGHAETLEGVFTRDGLIRAQAAALVPLPEPLPVEPARPPPAPLLRCGGVGEPEAVARAVVSIAERMYGSAEHAPDAVEWLLDDEFAFGEPYESASAFLGDLADAVAHQGTCTDSTVEAVPFLVEVACDDEVPAGTRVIVLGELLRLATTGPSSAVALADRIAALGVPWQEPAADYLTRRSIGHELPRLLARWDHESDAARFVLIALTAACGDQGGLVRPPLDELSAPRGTDRADVLALATALLDDDRDGLDEALRRLSSWLPRVAEKGASPHVARRDLGLAVLPDLVMEDAGSAVAR